MLGYYMYQLHRKEANTEVTVDYISARGGGGSMVWFFTMERLYVAVQLLYALVHLSTCTRLITPYSYMYRFVAQENGVARLLEQGAVVKFTVQSLYAVVMYMQLRSHM